VVSEKDRSNKKVYMFNVTQDLQRKLSKLLLRLASSVLALVVIDSFLQIFVPFKTYILFYLKISFVKTLYFSYIAFLYNSINPSLSISLGLPGLQGSSIALSAKLSKSSSLTP